MIFTALKQGHDVAAQSGLVARFFFDRCDLRFALLIRVFCRGARFHCALDASSDVLVRHQNIDLEVRRPQFLVALAREEALFRVVKAFRRDRLQLSARHMLVRDQQPIRRDKRARSPIVQPDGSKPHVFEPRVRRFEVVGLLPLLARWVVESPHALVGQHRKR